MVEFSVRTSKRRIHCGNLLNEVLNPRGCGGDHASTAGGFAAYDKLPGLGPENAMLDYINRQYA